MNYIDIGFLLILFLITFISAHKGLLYVISQFTASILAILLSKLLSQPLASFLYTRFIESDIHDKLADLLPEGSVAGELQKTADSVFNSLPDFIQKLAEQFHLVTLLHAGAGDTEVLTVDQIQTEFIAPLVTKAVSVVCFILMFILFILLLKFVALWLNRSVFNKKDGALSKFNKFAGALFGTLRGSITVFVIAVLLNLIASCVQQPAFHDLVVNSYVCNYISTWI